MRGRLEQWLRVLLVVACGLLPAVALAVEPSEMLSDPKLEARAEAIGSQLRCLVCQNESIESSGADLAHDLRVLVRQRIAAGDSDQEVIDYIVARYGEFVLLKPVLAPYTLALWFAAPVLIVVGGVVLVVAARRRRNAPPVAPLSAEEQAALAALDEEGEKTSS